MCLFWASLGLILSKLGLCVERCFLTKDYFFFDQLWILSQNLQHQKPKAPTTGGWLYLLLDVLWCGNRKSNPFVCVFLLSKVQAKRQWRWRQVTGWVSQGTSHTQVYTSEVGDLDLGVHTHCALDRSNVLKDDIAWELPVHCSFLPEHGNINEKNCF